jgi:hypothetical protein
MKKPAIPATSGLPQELTRVLDPIKTNIEIMTGARPGVSPIVQLGSSAQLSDLISKVNEVISRINQTG